MSKVSDNTVLERFSKTELDNSYEEKKVAVEESPCFYGNCQSPIDISEFISSNMRAELIFNYVPTKMNFINNGYTIQVNSTTDANTISIDNNQFSLQQFHFHTPSEHTTNGKSLPMELHLVHKDANGNLAVVGVMIQYGAENQVLSPIWDKISTQRVGQELELETSIDMVNIIPKDTNSLFRYMGSLTTPPYTEGVIWLVMEKPIEMSERQIETFRSVFPLNSRRVQPRNGREIIKYS